MTALRWPDARRILLPDVRRLLLILGWDLGGGGWRRWEATWTARHRLAQAENPAPRVERRIRARWRREEWRRRREERKTPRPLPWPVKRDEGAA